MELVTQLLSPSLSLVFRVASRMKFKFMYDLKCMGSADNSSCQSQAFSLILISQPDELSPSETPTNLGTDEEL